MPANRTGAPEREKPGPTRETGPLGKSAGTTHTDSANDTPAADAAQDLRDYLHETLGGTPGWLHVSTFTDPYWTAAGKYEHRNPPRMRWWRWPDQAEQAAAHITSQARHGDTYVCPYVLQDKQRVKGAGARRVAHTDVDHDHLDRGEVERLGAYAIASGTPGHAQVYVPLAYAVTPAQHDALCRGLVAWFGGDPGKISDNDLLRPAGTWNRKPTVAGGVIGGRPTVDGDPPAPVSWLVRPTGVRVDPFTLAGQLGVDINAAPAPTGPLAGSAPAAPAAPAAAAAAAPVDLANYPTVQAALDNKTGDRSADTTRVVGACRWAGLTLAQTRWVVNSRADLAERLTEFAERKKPVDDLLNVWLKIVDGEQTGVLLDPDALSPNGQVPGGGTEVVHDRIQHTAHLRMAYELSRQAKDKLLWVHGIGWHYFDGRRWAYDDKGVAKRAVYAMLKALWPKAFGDSEKQKALAAAIMRCETAAGVAGVLTLARPCGRSPPPWPTSTPILIYSTAPTARSTCAPVNSGRTTPPTESPKSPAPPTVPTRPGPCGRRSSRKFCPTTTFATICVGSSASRCSEWSSSTTSTSSPGSAATAKAPCTRRSASRWATTPTWPIPTSSWNARAADM